jgi:hypothetical protein
MDSTSLRQKPNPAILTHSKDYRTCIHGINYRRSITHSAVKQRNNIKLTLRG